jgi:phosphoribosylglycinamide formyltransferase-1
VIIQAAVAVHDDDSADDLAARILVQEHKIYPQAVRWFAEGRLQLQAGRVRLTAVVNDPVALISPDTLIGPLINALSPEVRP